MIVDAFLGLVAGLWSFVCTGLDAITPAVPAVVDGLPARVTSLAGYMAGTEAWIPWSVVGPMLAIVGTCFVASFAIKGFRIVASFLTAGGGSAG